MLEKRGSGEARPGDLAVVRAGRGRATLERVLGRASAIETVLEGLLVQEGERPGAMSDLDRSEGLSLGHARSGQMEGRVDLRGELAFTIDPETAKDFDDALTLHADRALVHIADVSWFVPTGSVLDRRAAERAFSVYVPGLVAPMLPPELSDDACSLRPHVDRLCVTVEVPLDAELRTGEPRFYRSVIRSRARLTYPQAEAILAGRERAEPELAEALRRAERVTTALRERRFARGALRIETGEVAFAFDGEGAVADARRESELRAHMLVEELMIRANEAVAALLAGRRREALYRVHERPEPRSVELLLSRLDDLEVPTPPAPDPMGPADAAAVAAEASEMVSEYARRSSRGRDAFPALVLQSLKQARYDPRNLGHSGLASPAYCHFTSPIRRYPDLVYHRALLRELGVSDEPLPDDLPEQAEHASARERHAAEIEYRADELCLAWLLEKRLFERGWDEPFAGEIVGVVPSGLFVRFEEVFEGFVPARRLPGDYFELNALGTALAGRRGGRRYRLGDPIDVRVHEIRRTEGKVELAPAAEA
ncbi:MAG TPA: RNB domain-containing ribonuclease [Gaiellaceae bacterium]|nr:RNB domain-containing ribonuclease [Gaiellaceae bacterium]